ncbi:hypothetical protein [Lacrimispora indolis]|uniref:hypothetical protein n=1 Tax=Lacrimispora indolis TaxID=69825 RepID=UPI000462C4F9|nr:hypothetical protein [[Clostridium] methoxybenzovorans]
MKTLILNGIESLSQDGKVLCVEVSVVYAYKDGRYTEEIEGTKYTLVLPALQYQRIEVRTKETSPNPEILQALSDVENESCPVEVEGFKARISVDFTRKELRLTCTADTVYEADEEVLIS